MATLAERAAEMLARRMKQTRGQAATYTRPATDSDPEVSAPLVVWPGRSEPESDDERQPRVSSTAADWLFAAADLVGVSLPPKKGDRITVAATGAVYELFAPKGGQCWGWSDPGTETVIRTHCQKKG